MNDEASDPDAVQFEAWQQAVLDADPAFLEVEVEGPYVDGSVSASIVSVTVDADTVTESQADAAVEAVVGSTRDEYAESQLKIGFHYEDAESDTGIGIIYLDGVVDSEYLQRDTYIAIYGTGAPVSSGSAR